MSRRCRSSPRWPGWPSRTSCRRPSGSPSRSLSSEDSCAGGARRSGTSGSTSPEPSSGCCFPSRSCSASSSCRREWSRTSTAIARWPPSTGGSQTITGGPVASQEVIKEFGTNGGGFYNANSAHPFENPNPLTDWVEILLLLSIPFALTYTFGRLVGDQRQGWVVFAAMFVLWAASVAVATGFEVHGNPLLDKPGVTQTATSQQAGGNLEGKEVRFGPAASGLFAALHDGHVDGRGELVPRQLHARRRRGSARQHDARRGQPRRHRFGPLRHARVRAPVGVHRRADGRPHPRVPGQEDPGARR